jgi:hypothetical protein
MKREIAVLLVTAVFLVGMAGAANYMYAKTDVNGVGYVSGETVVQTQTGLAGNKLVEKVSGSGNARWTTELEVQRDPFGAACRDDDLGCLDYVNFTKAAEFEYMPVSYQTGTYDAKWIDKLCVQNYYIGAVAVEMYTQAEHLQKNTEVKTRRDCNEADEEGGQCGDCTGALEANFNSNVIGVAHLGWLSKDVAPNSKGRHDEYGRSVEDLVGVFSVEKFIQLWGNDTCGAVQVDWLPCL